MKKKWMTKPFKHGTLIKIRKWYRKYLTDDLALSEKDRGYKMNEKYYKQFLSNEVFVYLGEIPQMSGHIICAGRDGKVYFGFHDDDFKRIPDDEA